MASVLILGGTGRIGAAVAQDVLTHTDASLVLTGRRPHLPPSLKSGQDRVHIQALSLFDSNGLSAAIAASDLVVHCAGPFRDRDLSVLKLCIAQSKPYVDVSDSPDYVRSALGQSAAAQAAGVTAVVSTGVFPGISNSMVRLAVEQFEQVQTIQLNYAVAGSGGAGKTVMRTTFLEIQHPFQAWVGGQWQTLRPYSEPEIATFSLPYGKVPVYWFNTSEAATLAESFRPLGAETVITKFGSLPKFYNELTALMTRGLWGKLLQSPLMVEFLAQVSYAMTQVSDRISGVGLAMQAQVSGTQAGEAAQLQVDFDHPNTAIAAGLGTGSVVADMLAERLHRPGVWPVEQAVSTELFLKALAQRGLSLQQQWKAPAIDATVQTL